MCYASGYFRLPYENGLPGTSSHISKPDLPRNSEQDSIVLISVYLSNLTVVFLGV